jgi:poly(3-hydroxybutyrate) depolymerase
MSGAAIIQAAPVDWKLFSGGNQPGRRSFGISGTAADGEFVPVEVREHLTAPFYRLLGFNAVDEVPKQNLLAVAPLSGHFPILMRDLVTGLLPHFRVYVTEWINVRHVPARYGPFDLEENVASILAMIRSLPAGLNVLGLCQGGVAALAATAILSQESDTRAPASLVLVGSPIDPMANPSRVAELLRSRPLSWFRENLIDEVSHCFPGRGRLVYPAERHLLPLWSYLFRHITAGSDTGMKVLFDDGEDPSSFPFLDLFTSLMDLDAAFFLENTRAVFQECRLPCGALRFRGCAVDPRAITSAALFTIEGERDDIAAAGQTSAAHGLCDSLPSRLHRSFVVPGAGHFSLFHGRIWRTSVLPAIREFCEAHSPAAAGLQRRVSIH